MRLRKAPRGLRSAREEPPLLGFELLRTQHPGLAPSEVIAVFAANLRRLRLEAGLSQEELGAKTGIGMSHISRYEAAQREPRIGTVARIAEALDVRPGDLLDEQRTE